MPNRKECCNYFPTLPGQEEGAEVERGRGEFDERTRRDSLEFLQVTSESSESPQMQPDSSLSHSL